MKKRDILIITILSIAIGGIAAGVTYDTRLNLAEQARTTETAESSGIAISQVKSKDTLTPYKAPRSSSYATNMSIGDLLTAANMSRQANGLPALQLNGQLNSSAQAKAQHMISFDYWTHVAPDGTEPWYFFNQAGYNYLRAGENLAYGFNTGFEVNTGWMNSATHRENILGDYADVGFGIANGVNYQSGENTVVVAHYGKPVQ